MSESATLTVTGMKCGGCENTVTTALTALDGVLAVKASFQEKKVEVEFDPAKVELEDIEDTIVEAGFKVE